MRNAWVRMFGAVAVIGLFAMPALAQTGKVTGVVTDASTGQPLEGVQVILQPSGVQALTASNGRYFIINVPPGTYAVIARRIGYTTWEARGVVILIDRTAEQNFALVPATTPEEIEGITVSVEEQPLVEPGVTGASTNIGAAEIAALPVTSIQGVLSLQQGFLEVPQNTDITSFTDTRRNTQSAVRVRGGRGGETVTLIDGVPINNFVFGGPAFDITTAAVQQLDFQRGGFEPQYGNALSGVINIATREGGSSLAGEFNWQTSEVGGALGNASDDLLSYNLFQGFVSGPIPGTANRLRFVAAGRTQNGKDGVYEFDDVIFDHANQVDPPDGGLPANPLDLRSGMVAFGYDHQRDVLGKLTYYFTPTMKLSAWGTVYERQRLPFDFDYFMTTFDPLTGETVNSLADSINIRGGSPNNRAFRSTFQDIIQGSIYVERDLYTVRWDHTLGRWAYQMAGSYFGQKRTTCNYLSGVCLGSRFFDKNFDGRFVAPGALPLAPGATSTGTDEFYGGEDLKTWMGRVDVQSQVSDHHQLQFGAFYQSHDLEYREYRDVGTNAVIAVPQFYTASPWEAAVYLQDRIEYDFLTVKLGARLDFGKAGGLFFAKPQDPLNGTSAREVCSSDPLAVERGLVKREYTYEAENGEVFTGFEACTQDPTLLSQATRDAQGDDFVEASSRTQFSPRIGVSFPLSERSQVFFNFGRFSQNPLFNNIFQNTNIGVDSLTGACSGEDHVKPGTSECSPNIFSDVYSTSFLGNPNLLIEKTTSYEVGYVTELFNDFAFGITLFSKDQFGLTGIRRGGVDENGDPIFDVGATYGSALIDYSVLLNQDFQTVRGFELSLRRRLSNYWGFNINYSFQQATTNAAPPERAFQSDEEGNPQSRVEIRSEIDQPHVFNASLFFQVGNEPPSESWWGHVLRNGAVSISASARSGFPYTPTTDFNGFGDNQLEVNSARAPGVFRMDAQISKDFTLSRLRYGAFLRVSNLTNSHACIQVFPSNGSCDAGSIDQNTARQGNAPDAESTNWDRPQYRLQPRSFNFGLRVSF